MFLNEFLDSKRRKHRVSQLTLEAYASDLTLLQHLTKTTLHQLDEPSIDELHIKLSASSISESTLRRRWSALNQFLQFLIATGRSDLRHPPTAEYRNPITDREESYHLTPNERESFFEYLNVQTNAIGLLDRAMFGLAYYCALRVTECITRTYSDLIEGDTPRLHILGKRNKVRVVPVHSTAIESLNIWLEHRPESEDQALFIHPTKTKKKLSRQFVWRRLKLVMKNAGLSQETISKSSPHTLRHTRASDLNRAGCDPLVISKFLGHSNLNTTSIYLHTTDHEIDKAVLEVS